MANALAQECSKNLQDPDLATLSNQMFRLFDEIKLNVQDSSIQNYTLVAQQIEELHQQGINFLKLLKQQKDQIRAFQKTIKLTVITKFIYLFKERFYLAGQIVDLFSKANQEYSGHRAELYAIQDSIADLVASNKNHLGQMQNYLMMIQQDYAKLEAAINHPPKIKVSKELVQCLDRETFSTEFSEHLSKKFKATEDRIAPLGKTWQNKLALFIKEAQDQLTILDPSSTDDAAIAK
jgi:hypothetical protein